jgi:hypothetical protein
LLCDGVSLIIGFAVGLRLCFSNFFDLHVCEVEKFVSGIFDGLALNSSWHMSADDKVVRADTCSIGRFIMNGVGEIN